MATTCRTLELHCEIQQNFWTPFGRLEECLVMNISVITPHDNVSSISNQFLNLDEIKSFYIYKSPLCAYIPFGIEKYFGNLIILSVTHSGLKFVTKEDLKALKFLKGLYLNNNELTILGSDFFSYNEDLQEINLNDNKLKHIAINVFDSATNLRKLELLRNQCVDESANNLSELELLFRKLHKVCPPKVVIHKVEKISNSSTDANTILLEKIAELEKKIEILQRRMNEIDEVKTQTDNQ